uniref:Uncharacterized protein n=1 Tax=Canis lupus familiaris TaxID=9615 RepID=A0A8C0NM23_CANLF
MFHFFRKSPESKKPSVPDTEADGFVLLGTPQRHCSEVRVRILTSQTRWLCIVALQLEMQPLSKKW